MPYYASDFGFSIEGQLPGGTSENDRLEAWLDEAEAKTGLNLRNGHSHADDALIAFYDGRTPQEFSDSLWVAAQ